MADAVDVAQPAAAAPAGGDDQQQQEQGNNAQQATSVWTVIKGLAFRMLVIYFISSMMRGWNSKPGAGQGNTTVAQTARPPAHNLFTKGMEFDLFIYLSDSATQVDLSDASKPFWSERALQYGDWLSGPTNDGIYTHTELIETTEQLRSNGSLYAHVYVVRSGAAVDEHSDRYDRRHTIYKVKQLNKFRRKRYLKTANLLTGESEQDPEDLKKAEIMKSEVISHWHPNVTINLIEDYTGWTQGALPPPLDEYIEFDKSGMAYYPIMFFNDYWNLASEYQPLNETVTHVNLSVTYSPMSLFKWQLYASQNMRNKWQSMLGGDFFGDDDQEDDQDSIKQALLETNPVLLGVTIVVSLLHTVFEFLAFKNDIQFWRSRKSLEGLSVRSVLFSCFSSLIVLLYVLDHDTNFVVKISVGIGMLIEMWKIPKCMNVSIDRENKWFGIVPRLVLSDKGSYVESSTKEYDMLAFKYLSWALYPLLTGYAIYSLMYHEHRGWYSFVLSMLYGFLLTFGFIMMTPQLFINYKLKSVAHLPWRMLTYKFINTFIDDLFAFVIRMPTMYRIGCFRDDIVFLVYLYQRWIYRVDPTRVNEFGTTGVDHGAAGAEGQEQQQQLTNGQTAEEQSAEGDGADAPAEAQESKKEQ